MQYLTNHEVTLFQGVHPDDLLKMEQCLSGIRKTYRTGETIMSYSDGASVLGIVAGGIVRLERIDYFGDCTLLDRLEKNDIFGDVPSYSSINGDEVIVICEKDCEIIFVDHDRIIHPCSRLCACHLNVTTNLLTMITNKVQRLSMRVEILSNKSIRAKLMSFFAMEARRSGSNAFQLPFSNTALASYICVDRSAMMREISRMKKEGLIEAERRNIHLLRGPSESNP